MLSKLLKLFVLLLALGFVWHFLFIRPMEPSNDRDWLEPQAKLATAEFNGDLITINNVRNFRFKESEDQFEPGYYNKTYNVAELKNVYYIVEHFSDFKGEAHTFLSFEFENNDFVVITVEARKEKGEDWHPITGLFNDLELIYVIADERDALRLRTNTRGNQVYAFPIKAEQSKKQQVFVSMVSAANELAANPKFYNTAWDNCTTTIVKHVNSVTPNKVPWSWKFFLPGYSGKLAYDLGMIDTDLPYEEAEAKYLVSTRAREYTDDENFSVKIREGF